MVEDTDGFHGLPIFPSPERRSPTINDHLKQPQQHCSPCTTQAPPQAMTNDQTCALSGYCDPSEAPSPQRLETLVPDSSQNPAQERDGTQNGEAEPSQQDHVFGDQRPSLQYSPEELQERMKVMWPSQPLDPEGYDGYGVIQRSSSDTGVVDFPSLSADPLDDGSEYETRVSPQQAWPPAPQNLLHQHYAWRPSQSSTQSLDHQSLYYSSRLGLATTTDEIYPSLHSASYTGALGNFKNESGETDYLNSIPMNPGYHTSGDNLPTTLSPCSASLAQLGPPFPYDPPHPLCQDREVTQPLPEHWAMDEYRDELYCPAEDSLDGSPSSIEPHGSKVDEPYAQLIYRAFMSRPNRSMTLQEIYQWFRENTDKAKSEGKGWQNSIRHNLSMNGAFTKRNSKAAIRDPNDGSLSFDPAAVDQRKSTEWYLEPKFFKGVESTTRYRRGNSGSRSRAAAAGGGGHSSKSSSRAHDGGPGSYSHARVTAGRKGGNVAAQNRRRQAEKQQQQQQARAHMARFAMRNGGFHGPMPQYPPGFPVESDGYHPLEFAGAAAAAHHPTPSPFAQGFAQNGRHVDMNYFVTRDLGNNLDVKRSTTLNTDDPQSSEPITPPESAEDPPRSKQDDYLHDSDMMGPYGGGYASGQQLHGPGPHQQLSSYNLGDVVGAFDPPAGSEQPTVFYEDDAALFGMLENGHH